MVPATRVLPKVLAAYRIGCQDASLYGVAYRRCPQRTSVDERVHNQGHISKSSGFLQEEFSIHPIAMLRGNRLHVILAVPPGRAGAVEE